MRMLQSNIIELIFFSLYIFFVTKWKRILAKNWCCLICLHRLEYKSKIWNLIIQLYQHYKITFYWKTLESGYCNFFHFAFYACTNSDITHLLVTGSVLSICELRVGKKPSRRFLNLRPSMACGVGATRSTTAARFSTILSGIQEGVWGLPWPEPSNKSED